VLDAVAGVRRPQRRCRPVSVPFTEILGATVRDHRKGVVDAYIDNGPTISFRVHRESAGDLQARVDRAAASE